MTINWSKRITAGRTARDRGPIENWGRPCQRRGVHFCIVLEGKPAMSSCTHRAGCNRQHWRCTFRSASLVAAALAWIFRRPATRSREHCRNFANQKVVKNSLSFSTATNPRPKFRQGNGLRVTAYISDDISGLKALLRTMF